MLSGKKENSLNKPLKFSNTVTLKLWCYWWGPGDMLVVREVYDAKIKKKKLNMVKDLKEEKLYCMLVYTATSSFVQVALLLNGYQDYCRTIRKDLKGNIPNTLCLDFLTQL